MNSIQEVNFSPADMTVAFHQLAVDHLIAVGHATTTLDGPLYQAKLLPLKENAVASLTETLDDVTPSDYDGAAAEEIAWNAAMQDEAMLPYSLADRIEFMPTGDDTIGEQPIRAVAITSPDGLTLYGVKNLSPAITVNLTTPARLDVTYSLLPPANPG